ncbi:MAG: bifunctional metallophosphatase/5'-nucleotidase [Spirochaetota bacterium]|jgi:2',3'-cyclic-nucleotide 2'-phosphodiesterase (5'-nucleotidase family)|nr:bifunctional metallophosphatase/5'-nucleotidase [Spirochaetota bacterium]
MSIMRVRLLAPVFGIWMLILCSCGSESVITILHFADFHDFLQPAVSVVDNHTNEVGGIARLIGTVLREKSAAPDSTFVLSAGDAVQGTTFSTFFKGEIIYSLFDKFVDYTVLGVHDLDYSLENLIELTKDRKYQFLAANVLDKEAKPFSGRDYAIREVNGVKIGFFGLTKLITAILQSEKNIGYLNFAPVEDVAKTMVQTLRSQGADIIIALTHQGFEEDKKLARTVEGIDLIVGGLSHTNLIKGFQTFDTIIVQAGFRGENVGKVVIRYDKKKKTVISITPTIIPVIGSSPADAESARVVEEYAEDMATKMGVVIAKTDVHLEGTREVVRRTETNLANMITDFMCLSSGAELCLINSGVIRASISEGDIRVADVINTLPYPNSVSVVRIPGRAIYRILEKSAACLPGEGRFLQVSKGVSYKIRGRVLEEFLFNGREIDFNRYYAVATSDFLADGGDNYPEFKQDLNPKNTGQTMAECIIAVLRQVGSVSPKIEGRIVRLEE